MPDSHSREPRRLAMGLRTKLLLVTLTLLAIPWAGYQYVREMEGFLREGQEDALLATASAVATALHERPALFREHADLFRSVREGSELYAHPLPQPVQLDGYADEWGPLLSDARSYGTQYLLESDGEYWPGTLSFRHIAGTYGAHLYALFQITDDRLVYRRPTSLRVDRSDHLIIGMESPDGELKQYVLTTEAPGWVNAHLVTEQYGRLSPVRPEVKIKGEWQETAEGYTLEIRIPLKMTSGKLAFAVADVDDAAARKVNAVVGTAGTRRVEELGAVMVPSPEIERILKGLARSPSRLWVIDAQRRVLALSGSLEGPAFEETAPRGFFSDLMYAFYELVLAPDEVVVPVPAGATRLEGPEIESALAGEPAVRWRDTGQQREVIVAATYPVTAANETVGAVVAEQTSSRILSLRNRAMVSLFVVTVAVLGAGTLFLLTFASRLSARIRRLRDEAELAIGRDGRVRAEVNASRAGDEVGDLSRSVADMLARLSQYTRYLETMAGKLSHELRTPLTVVKSSLDNLEMTDLPDGARVYTRRAREGAERLGTILTRLSEATRLEQALQHAERERFDLAAVVRGCIEGYRDVYPGARFELEIRDAPLVLHGVAEFIGQMLDKLVGNAVDFSAPGAPIRVVLERDGGDARLSVANEGEPLPEGAGARLFESMVSMREAGAEQSHLGLGLYIVRLISEFFGGHVSAASRDDVPGAVFRVYLPLRERDQLLGV